MVTGKGWGRGNKSVVMALVQRHGEIRPKVIDRVNSFTLKAEIRKNVHPSATIYTDELSGYKGIGKEFKGGHHVVNHSKEEYVRGHAYTNTAESFFSLFKRGIVGQFHHLSKQHLHRYCDEFAFRWNHREKEDFNRTFIAIKQAEGKRLMYKEPRFKSQGDGLLSA